MKDLINNIPLLFFESLKHLMHHLFLVSRNCAVNLMEPKNLAIIFGPSVVRESNETLESVVKDMKHQCRIIEALLLYVSSLSFCICNCVTGVFLFAPISMFLAIYFMAFLCCCKAGHLLSISIQFQWHFYLNIFNSMSISSKMASCPLYPNKLNKPQELYQDHKPTCC